MSVRRGRHPGSISLMLKACAQDAGMIGRMVPHIVGQLGDAGFDERYLVVDPRPGEFLRQYAPANAPCLHRELDSLVHHGWLDSWCIAPADGVSVVDLYRRWFSCETTETHSNSGVPVSPQLYGFERSQSDYLLQADMDVIIGRRDPDHDYLSDMAFALDADPRRVSVSFNIPHRHAAYVLYDAPPGGYVPEVRLCLMDLRKLREALPLPNEVGPDGRLVLNWYRALQRAQQQDGWLSVRGGDARSYFIHPMNTAKRTDRWLDVVAQVERGHIPETQFEHHDLVEDLDAWDGADDDPHDRLVLPPGELLEALERRPPARSVVIALRHAEKEWMRPNASAADLDDAPLTDRARGEVSGFVADLPIKPAVVLTSPLPRCRATARLIADALSDSVHAVVLDELLGAPFHQRGAWHELKRKLGWSQLVARWLSGEIDRAVVLPFAEWLPTALRAIQQNTAPGGATIVVTQGYLNTAFGYHLTGRIEYRGGPLHGFIWPADSL